jgi:ribosomal protein L16
MAIANFRPKKLAHKKSMKGFYRSRAGGSLRGTTVYHGDYALQVTEGGRLFDRQLDTARNMVRRIIKQDKGSKFILSQFPHRPVTSKGAETRMGKGKGVVEHFATWMRTGSIVFEVKGARREIARRALRAAAGTLPLRSRIIKANPDMRVAPRCLPHFIMKTLHEAEFAQALESGATSKDSPSSLKRTAKLQVTKE